MQHTFSGENAKSKESRFNGIGIQDGSSIHHGCYCSNPGTSCGKDGRIFVVSESTAALLSLCVELDMVIERVEYLGNDRIDRNIFDAREELQSIVNDRIRENLAFLDNIRNKIVKI